MKKLIIVFILLFIMAGLSAQGFHGFFKPVDKSLYVDYDVNGDRVVQGYSFWQMRPLLTLTAMKFTFEKPVTVSSLSSLGTGLSYQHFIEQNGEPYANFGVNFIVLFTEQMSGINPAKLSIAVTGMAWQFVNFGAGYDFDCKKMFLLTSISYSFN